MNRAISMGRLTRDPEVRYSQGECSMVVTRYALAVDRRGRRNQDSSAGQRIADFIDRVVFDRAVKFAEKHFRQGMRVLVPDRIQTGSHVNKESRRVYTIEVILDDQEFADNKSATSEMGGCAQAAPLQRPILTGAIGDRFMNIPDGVEDEGFPFDQDVP